MWKFMRIANWVENTFQWPDKHEIFSLAFGQNVFRQHNYLVVVILDEEPGAAEGVGRGAL